MINSVALLGAPNSGKTTLFNWLTGHQQKIVNYPGSTIDIFMGPLLSNLGAGLQIIDTPGTYSLFPKSQDEEITRQTLYDDKFDIKKVIVIIDSTQISRQLHLVRQAQEAGFQIVVALTMLDLYAKGQASIDIHRLSELLRAPVVAIDGILGGGVKELVEEVNKLSNNFDRNELKNLEQWPLLRMQEVFREGELFLKEFAHHEKLKIFDSTEAKDKIFLHPFFGPLIFGCIMVALFSSIYWAAAPLMDFVDSVFSNLSQILKSALPDNLFSTLITDGIVSGLGAVLIFTPQIFILFIGISLLEDSGYLSRAAALVDKPLSKVGLNGKAFVPLLSGFACAVPAMMAARAINSSKERMLATFIIPFMTCSARLPVYALLIGFLFSKEPLKAGLLMALLYSGGLIIGFIASGLLDKLIKSKKPSFFVLELPIYRMPKMRTVIRNSARRTFSYIYKTGPIIMILSLVLWVLSTFPNYKELNQSRRLESSYASQIGKSIEPVFYPLGVDWRVGVGLISAFAAREVFVSSLAVIFNNTQGPEDSIKDSLLERMNTAEWPDGRKLFTKASIFSLLVFFMIAMQCMSTFATAKQEMNSLKFAILQSLSMNLVAYIAAAITYSVIS